MPFAPYEIPLKPCESCGTIIERPRFSNGELEPPSLYTRRKYCSLSCAGLRKNITKNSYHKRARKLRGKECEACGTTKQLQAHHLDQDWMNNTKENIQTLCKTCHDFWHTTARRLGRKIAGRMPRIVLSD